MARAVSIGVCVMLVAVGCGKDEPARTNKAAEAKADDGGGKRAPEAPTPATSGAPDAAAARAAAWSTYRDPRFGFSVDAPRAPVISEQVTPTPDGDALSHNYMFSPPNAKGAMLVMVTPSVGADFDFDEGQRTALATMAGTVVTQANTELDGHRGREFRFTATPQGHAVTGYNRMYVRDGTLYQALMVYADDAQAQQLEGERFVASFGFAAP